jgi:hypothetical protein
MVGTFLEDKKEVAGLYHFRSRYTDEDMQLAFEKVQSEGWSVARAAREIGVPRVTLLNKIHGLHKTGEVGRPTSLTKMEERVLVDLLILMGDYNYPITKRHLQDMVKGYLDRRDRQDSRYGVFDEKWENFFFHLTAPLKSSNIQQFVKNPLHTTGSRTTGPARSGSRLS